jgi:hypothetical protein
VVVVVVVVVVSLVVGLGSLAYPSVQVTVFHTETFSNTSSYAYSVAVFTAVLVPYSTTRALHSYYYEPGNFPGCDPTQWVAITVFRTMRTMLPRRPHTPDCQHHSTAQ